MGLFKKFRDAWFAPMSFDSLDDDFMTGWRNP